MSLPMRSIRLRRAKAPSDIPRMNAESMISNACVEAPSPVLSMRIQVIS
jgi:hypothetical protein